MGTKRKKHRPGKSSGNQFGGATPPQTAQASGFAGTGQHSRPTPTPKPAPPSATDVANDAIRKASWALRSSQELLFQNALDTLVASPVLPQSGAQRIGPNMVESTLIVTIRRAWKNGWQPLDLAHVTARRLGDDHRAFVAKAVGIECVTAKELYVDQRWRDQLLRIGAIDGRQADTPSPLTSTLFPLPSETTQSLLPLQIALRVALELIELIAELPPLPLLIPPPGPTHSGHITGRLSTTTRIDDKVLEKVRALLAKAESTTFEEEANALTAKAQELMARHAIDIAMLDSTSAVRVGAAARRIHIDDPYVDAKSSLLSAVAEENRCRAITTTSLGFVTVLGFDSDLDIVELLFTSLLIQATSAMLAAGKVSDSSGRSRTKSFRQSFLVAFASRIGERLHAAGQAASQEAATTFGESFLPVLASRDEQVGELTTKVFPKVTFRRTSVSNAAGWTAGQRAADRASLETARAPIARR